jgi:hypothetical protein
LEAQSAAAPAARELLTVDKDFDLGARVNAYGATPSLAERDGRLTLQVAFAPGENPYPGVHLAAPGGTWDLKDCNRVLFQVANTGAAEVRLGCRVNDGPVTDGHKHCNTEMVALKPGESKSVTVTFGRSYGGPGWKLDPANVVGLSLHAEKPTAPTTVAVQGIQALVGDMPRPLRMTANDTWQPIQHHLVPEKGSALDFAFLLDAPAGKHGSVVIRNGRMEHRDKPGRPARFYGANVVYGANFPDKATAETMADQLARNGYNSLRFHHFDQLILDKDANDSLTFDAAQLDKIDYFFACLKERGIYITIDLYATRETRPQEIPEINAKTMMSKYKSAVYILDSARRNWEEFSRRLLTHVNPYTTLAWKDDPALFSLSLINEGQVYQTWEANKKLYQERFDELNKAAAASQTPDQKAAAWNWFLTDIQRRWTKEATAFVRSLGTDVLITDANYIPMRPLSVFRTDLDVVDIHCYYDGPQPLKGWGAPLKCNHGNLVKDGGVHMPLYSVAGRLLGKPFMITEFNMGYPNRFRGVCGPMVGAFSAFQEIDAVYRFDHIGVPLDKPGAIIWLSSANDPVALLGERIGAAMFLREDVRAAESVVPYLVTDDYLNKPKALDWSHWYNDSYIAIGSNHKIGTVVLQKDEKLAHPAKALVSTETVPQERLGDATLVNLDELGKLWPLLKNARPADAPPAQIDMDRGKGTLRIVTERSECLFVPDKLAKLEGDFLRAENAEFHATIGAVSLDGLPLAASRRVVILHLTDVVNDGELYRDDTMGLLETYGGPGLLVRKGAVRLTLRGVGDGAKLYALDLDGKRKSEVASTFTDAGLSFPAQTHRSDGTCLAYELIRNMGTPP